MEGGATFRRFKDGFDGKREVGNPQDEIGCRNPFWKEDRMLREKGSNAVAPRLVATRGVMRGAPKTFCQILVRA